MKQILKIGNKAFNLGERTFIMGILNVTLDSFSDGGRYDKLDNALKHAEEMIAQGADIIDIGGESTRPNHTPVSTEEELARVLPIIKAVKANFDVPISIDTSKAEVADLAIIEGAALINDVWGFKKDSLIASIAGKHQVPCCLMHNRTDKNYNNLIEDMLEDLKASIRIALAAGVKPENIILDPGIGFAKTYENNLEVLKRLEEFKILGYPLLLGTSRKSVIGNALNLPTNKRVEGTIATTVIGILKGYDFVRVHDVLENKRAAVMTDAILGKR